MRDSPLVADATRDRIIERYELKPAQIHQIKSLLTPDQQAEQHGDALWASHPDRCCQLRKVEPLRRILGGFDAWRAAGLPARTA